MVAAGLPPRCGMTTTHAHRRRDLFTLFTTVLLITGWMHAPLAAQADSAFGTVGLTAGWATFGEAVPQGAAYSGLQVGTLPTQTDIKSRWPDGSIRFAVVTVNSPASASYGITDAVAPTGTFTPTPPAASVALTVGTVTYVAALPNIPSSDLWLSGPLVYEARSVVSPISSADGSAHPFLRVNFDTRVYSDGTSRVDVSVENVIDMAGAKTVTYDVAMTVNGQTAFAQAAVQHYYLTRWRKLVTVGAAPVATVTPDFGPFNRANALPPYLSVVANTISAPTGTSYNILNAGALEPNMPAHGGRAELAPYPDWTARYLVYKNPTQRSFVLANGDLSGSWPVHVREAAGSAKSGVGPERLVSLDQRPTIWYDPRAQGDGLDFVKGGPMPMVEYGSTTPGPGQSPLIPDDAHQPSIAYVPYLITGDRYYAEEMAFWANYSMLRTYPADGVRGSQGILAYNEVRGYAWALRNIADAAAYYPDASPVRSYLSQKVTANLQWLDRYANAQDPTTNPFRILWLNKRPDGAQYIGMWEQNYLAYAIDRANKQGFAGGTAHRDAIAKFQLQLFNSDPDYPRAQGAPYLVGVGTPAGNSFTFFTSMAQIWAATQGNERPFAGYYGPEARLNLMMAVDSGWPGAQAAYDYLWPFIGTTNTYCPSGGPDKPDLACRAGWALDFAGSTSGSGGTVSTAPAQMIAPAAGSTLASSSQTFSWTTGTGVSSYRLDVGTTVGANNLYAGTAGTSLSAAVSGLPTAGGTLWARVSSNINGAWQSSDYSYTASLAAPPPTPLTFASPSAGSISANAATITWTTNLASSSRVDYGVSTAYGATVADGSQLTAHSLRLSSLSPSTVYHYTISSQAGSGATVKSGDLTFVTASQLSASITAPVSGSTASGTVSVSATASGTSGVAGVQFMLDGGKAGSEVLAAPFSMAWNTTAVANGTHTLTAVARDATGNSVVSAPLTVSVLNSGSPSATGIVVDRVVSADGKGTLRSAAFTTSSAGELLVAFAASDGPSSGAQTLNVSGAGLSWTLVRRVNAQAGTTEIWTARASGTLSNVTVTATQGRTGYHQSLTVVTFTGAAGIGASSAANGAAGAPSIALTTTVAGSMVFGSGNDWDRAIARTIGPNQTMVHQWVDSATGDTYWVQGWKGSVAASGTTIRLNDSAPTGDRWNFAAVEIAAQAVPSGTGGQD
jgi:Bacterial Ig domain